MANADTASIELGARVPIILTSRADDVRTRMASCGVAKLYAYAPVKWPPRQSWHDLRGRNAAGRQCRFVQHGYRSGSKPVPFSSLLTDPASDEPLVGHCLGVHPNEAMGSPVLPSALILAPTLCRRSAGLPGLEPRPSPDANGDGPMDHDRPGAACRRHLCGCPADRSLVTGQAMPAEL